MGKTEQVKNQPINTDGTGVASKEMRLQMELDLIALERQKKELRLRVELELLALERQKEIACLESELARIKLRRATFPLPLEG